MRVFSEFLCLSKGFLLEKHFPVNKCFRNYFFFFLNFLGKKGIFEKEKKVFGEKVFLEKFFSYEKGSLGGKVFWWKSVFHKVSSVKL